MRIVSGRLPRSRYLERGAAELSREVQRRLPWFDHYQAQGRNATLTCRYFGISRVPNLFLGLKPCSPNVTRSRVRFPEPYPN
jgi:hypothetical protein